MVRGIADCSTDSASHHKFLRRLLLLRQFNLSLLAAAENSTQFALLAAEISRRRLSTSPGRANNAHLSTAYRPRYSAAAAVAGRRLSGTNGPK